MYISKQSSMNLKKLKTGNSGNIIDKLYVFVFMYIIILDHNFWKLQLFFIILSYEFSSNYRYSIYIISNYRILQFRVNWETYSSIYFNRICGFWNCNIFNYLLKYVLIVTYYNILNILCNNVIYMFIIFMGTKSWLYSHSELKNLNWIFFKCMAIST